MTVLILFNHDSKYRNPRFLLPRIIRAIKKKEINYIVRSGNKNNPILDMTARLENAFPGLVIPASNIKEAKQKLDQIIDKR